jgi:sigma-B regulation protein RsbU (phosphoserine phosphatase)
MKIDKKFIESLRFLSQTSRILTQPLQKGELISTILEESLKLSDADLVSLVMLDQGRSPDDVFVMSPGSKKKLHLDPEDFDFNDQGCEMSVPCELDENDVWNDFFKEKLERQYKCRLRLPLFFKNKWSGHLDFYSRNSSCFETENMVDFLKALADSFSLAYENAELRELVQKKTFENRLLIDTSQMLANVLEQDEVLAAIAEALKLVVDYDAISIYLLKEDGYLYAIHSKGYDDPEYENLLRDKLGAGLVGWAAKTGQGVVVDDVSKDSRYIIARNTTKSELVVPIKLKDRVIGVFNIESDRENAYKEHDLDLLSTFAAKSAIAIERATLYRELVMKRQLDQEVSIARSIQKTFLPRKKLEFKGFDIAGINISSHQVGGDYFDYIKIEEGQTGLVIADVSGKGIPASLIMASFRASLIAEIRNNYAIRAIMQKVNRLMTESLDQGNFVTAVYGVLDNRSKIFTFSNAGHFPPILIDRDGKRTELKEGGIAFGIEPNARYEERPIGLHDGDILIFFTDGVTEVQNPEGDQFETDRLVDIVKKNRAEPAKEIAHKIVDAIHEFKDPDFILDDLTIMILKVIT